MADTRIPDPTLMARLQLSVKGVDWAASRVKPWQHDKFESGWSAHENLVHLLRVETTVFHARIPRFLQEDAPDLGQRGAPIEFPNYTAVDIEEVAELFVAARQKTYDIFKELTPDQWRRTATWPDGRVVDMSWVAEKALWHALEHFAVLLDIHQEFEPLQSK